MKTTARVEVEVYVDMKGTTKGGTVRKRAKLIEVDVVLGDGNAEVGWTMPIRIASKYSRVSVGGTAHVFLHCNQDEKTIKDALECCRRICGDEIREAYEGMKPLLVQLDDEIVEECGVGG
mgnify:CR=1 FL=1